MTRRTKPSRAFLVRDRHRNLLVVHFFAALAGTAMLMLFNRFVVPGVFWAHWVALAWAALFLVHFGWFSRATIATMGGHATAEAGADAASDAPGAGAGGAAEPAPHP